MKQTICTKIVSSLYCTIAIKIAFLPIISQSDHTIVFWQPQLFQMPLFFIFNYTRLMWIIITCLTFGSHRVVHLPFQTNSFVCISIKNICSLEPYYTKEKDDTVILKKSTFVLLVSGQNGLGSTDQ